MKSLAFICAIGVVSVYSCTPERTSPRFADTGRVDGAAAAAEVGRARDWLGFVKGFASATFRAQPQLAVRAGYHEFDGEMPDWTASAIEREVVRLQSARSDALRFLAESLTPAHRLERQHLLAVIDEELFWMQRVRWPFRNPQWYLTRLDPEVYVSLEYAAPEKRLAAYIRYAQQIPRIAAEIRRNLERPLPTGFAERAVSGFGGFADYYRNVAPKAFASVGGARAQQELINVSDAAARAMESLKALYAGESGEPADDFVLGEPLLLEMLRQTERIEIPLERLEAAGRADLQRNLTALREICARYAPGNALHACIGKMKAQKPTEGLVAVTHRQIASLRDFIAQQKLLVIPGDDQVALSGSPPPLERNLPQVHYFVPASRAAEPDGEPQLLLMAVHEVWPGHFVRFLHGKRNSSLIAQIWTSYAYDEGWALYAEEMMCDAGLCDGRDEIRIAQLAIAIIRDVRFLATLGLHAGRMSLEEAENLFRESAFMDPAAARRQALRGTYDPGYLSYTLGKLVINKLRDDWIAKRFGTVVNPRQHWPAFHDAFLSYSGLPLPLVRRAMIGGDAEALL